MWWAKREVRKRGGIITLAFHRVLDDDSFATTNSLPGILVRERTFRDLVAYVMRNFEPVGLDDAMPGTRSQKIKVVFTFDDGWRDNYTIVFPIARASGLPFTVFICPGVSGQTAPFWPERACSFLRVLQTGDGNSAIPATIEELKHFPTDERERYLASLREQAIQRHALPQPLIGDQVLSSAEIIEMDKAGVGFGSHTHTHQILTSVPSDLAEAELRQSKSAIEELLGRPCTSLAYPNGDWSSETKSMAAKVKFTRAVTLDRGAWTSASDNLAIPRSYMCETTVTGFRGRFSPLLFEYVAFWLAWRAMGKAAAGRSRTINAREAKGHLQDGCLNTSGQLSYQSLGRAADSQ
ncbi:MAG: polysaccharide deacetylase family protein [Terriglobales bacterium]